MGSITYVALDYLFPQWIGLVVGTVLATALRLAAMILHWRLRTGPRELIKVIDVSLVPQTRVANAWAAKSAAWSAIPLVL